MRRASILFITAILLIAWTTDADARRGRSRPRKAPKKEKADKRTAAAIAAMTGRYKWGLKPQKVVRLIIADFRKSYIKRIRKARSAPRKRRWLRKELKEKIAKVKRGDYKFSNAPCGWNVSIVDDQFKHGNQESMIAIVEKEQQRFFFFHNGRLYKQFIAYYGFHKSYKGLTFAQLRGKLSKTFGEGRPVFRKDGAGLSYLHHVEWIGAKNVRMWAVDKYKAYGKFCVVLFHQVMKDKVKKGWWWP